MATKIWTGSVDGNFQTAGNWNGGVPVSNDDAIVPSVATRSMDAGMDQSGAVDLDSLVVHRGYAGNIGSSGNPLKIAADKVLFMGAGEFWFENDITTDDVRIIAATPQTVVNLGGDTITSIAILRGKVTIDGTTGAIADLNVGYFTDRLNDSRVTIAASAGTLTSLFQDGGKLWAGNTITTAHAHAGELTKQGTTSIVTLEQHMGANVIYNSSGTITLARLRGGTLDLTQTGDVKAITTLWLFPDSTFKEIQELHTVTTRIDLRNLA